MLEQIWAVSVQRRGRMPSRSLAVQIAVMRSRQAVHQYVRAYAPVHQLPIAAGSLRRCKPRKALTSEKRSCGVAFTRADFTVSSSPPFAKCTSLVPAPAGMGVAPQAFGTCLGEVHLVECGELGPLFFRAKFPYFPGM